MTAFPAVENNVVPYPDQETPLSLLFATVLVPEPTAIHILLLEATAFPCVEKILVPNPVHDNPSVDVKRVFVEEPTATNFLISETPK